MLLGLRLPDRGLIKLDGRDLRSIAPPSARRLVALAGPLEFTDASVRENLRLGRDPVSADDVRDALRLVGLEESLGQLPRGLDTPMRADGAPLSGGQQRRLLLARALAGRPALLVPAALGGRRRRLR